MTNKTKKQSPKSYMVYHENPEVFHVGTIESHSYFIPFAKGENPFESREKSSRFELLNGEWGFSHYTSIIDLEDDFIDVKPRGKISVPSNWQLQGYSSENDRIQYTNVSYPIPYNPPFAPDDIPVGVYTRSYFYDGGADKVAAGGADRKILCFEGVDCCFYLYINGEFAGYSEVSHNTSEFDITSLLHEGENKITVAVLKWGFGTYLEDQDKLRLSGIFRDVYVLTRPVQCLKNYTVQTVLGENNELNLQKEVSGSFDSAVVKVFVEANVNNPIDLSLFAPDGKLIEKQTVSAATSCASAATSSIQASFNISKPLLWSAENPVLYRLQIECGDEVIGEEVGIRKICVENGVIKVNGVAVKFRGVNRHDS